MTSNNNNNHPPLRNLNKTISTKRIKQLTQKIIFEIKQTSPNSLNPTERNFLFDKIPRHIAKAFLGEITPQDCSTIAALATLNILSFQFIELILYAVDGCMLNNLTTNSFLEKSIFDCITIHLLKMETPSDYTINIFSWNISKNKMMAIHGTSPDAPNAPDTPDTPNTTNTTKPTPTPNPKNKNKKNKKNPIRRKLYQKHRTLYRFNITHQTTPMKKPPSTTTTTTTTSTTTKTSTLHMDPTPNADGNADAYTNTTTQADTTLQFVATPKIHSSITTTTKIPTTNIPTTNIPITTTNISTTTPPPICIQIQKQELNITDIIDLTTDDNIPDNNFPRNTIPIDIETINYSQHNNENNLNTSETETENGIENENENEPDVENNPTETKRPSWQFNCGSYSSSESWRNSSNNYNDFYDSDNDERIDEAEFNLDLSIEKSIDNNLNATQFSQLSDYIHTTEANLQHLINQHIEHLREDTP